MFNILKLFSVLKYSLFGFVLGTLLFAYPIHADDTAGMVFETFPNEIKPDEKYVFYSHGYIVEGSNPKPVHPEWGIYDFPDIKVQLQDPKYNVIAYHRPAKTNPFEYAKTLAKDIRSLIASGVKPENIVILGFSRGGSISILTANELKLSKVKTIILAGCGGLIKRKEDVKVYGNVYSIFETSDQVGSCQFLIDRSADIESFNEIAISTGKSHGAFYRPIPEWLVPVKAWIKSE